MIVLCFFDSCLFGPSTWFSGTGMGTVTGTGQIALCNLLGYSSGVAPGGAVDSGIGLVLNSAFVQPFGVNSESLHCFSAVISP